jgi:hypothetical protein
MSPTAPGARRLVYITFRPGRRTHDCDCAFWEVLLWPVFLASSGLAGATLRIIFELIGDQAVVYAIFAACSQLALGVGFGMSATTCVGE